MEYKNMYFLYYILKMNKDLDIIYKYKNRLKNGNLDIREIIRVFAKLYITKTLSEDSFDFWNDVFGDFNGSGEFVTPTITNNLLKLFEELDDYVDKKIKINRKLIDIYEEEIKEKINITKCKNIQLEIHDTLLHCCSYHENPYVLFSLYLWLYNYVQNNNKCNFYSYVLEHKVLSKLADTTHNEMNRLYLKYFKVYDN